MHELTNKIIDGSRADFYPELSSRVDKIITDWLIEKANGWYKSPVDRGPERLKKHLGLNDETSCKCGATVLHNPNLSELVYLWRTKRKGVVEGASEFLTTGQHCPDCGEKLSVNP